MHRPQYEKHWDWGRPGGDAHAVEEAEDEIPVQVYEDVWLALEYVLEVRNG